MVAVSSDKFRTSRISPSHRAVAYGVPPSQQGASSSSSNSIQQQRQHPLLQRRGSLEDDEEDELMQMPFQRFLSKERREKSAR